MDLIKDTIVGILGESPEELVQHWLEIGRKMAKAKSVADSFEARRKAIISLFKVNVRKTKSEQGIKATDDTVDTEAHASQQYIDWLKEAIKEKEEAEKLSVEFKAIEKRLDFLRSYISYAKKEI